MDTRKEEYERGTPVIFLPSPNNKSYKHHGKKGKIGFKENRGDCYYIFLEETEIIFKNRPLQKKVPIKVIGHPEEFKIKL
jgi:hypothetical protein